MTASSDTAFTAWLEPHLGPLYRAARRLTGSRPDAEDLFQDVCLRAYAERHALRTIEQPLRWLLKVQYRIFIDATRRRRRSPLRPTPMALDADALPSCDAGPEELTEAALAERRLLAAWPQLERGQRALLALHAEGYGLSELAAITDLTPDVLKARLYRARVRLGRLLETPERNRALALEN
jgi:RNA polymerase sigma-70 factor (ECF subfamily)